VAGREGGILARLIQESNPDEDFFAFFVAANAIDTFRQVRRMVARKGFAVYWDTDQDKPFIKFLDEQQSGGPAMQHRKDLLRSRGTRSKASCLKRCASSL
jgi:hypothetical protein